MSKEVAITYDHRTGFFVVFETTVHRDGSGTALSDGFVAKQGFVN